MTVTLRRALRAEWFLTLRSPAVWLTVLLPTLAALLAVLDRKFGVLREQATRRVLGDDPGLAELAGNGWAPLAAGIDTGIAIAAPLLLALAAIGVARERDLGTGRAALVRATTRTSSLLSRFLVLLAVALSVVLAVLAAAAGPAALCFEFGPIAEEGYVHLTSAEIGGELTTAVLGALLPLITLIALGLLFGVAAPNAVAALAAAFLTLFVFEMGRGVIGDSMQYLFAWYLPGLGETSCLSEVEKLAQGYSDAGYSAREKTRNLTLPLPEALLLLAVALWTVRRRRM